MRIRFRRSLILGAVSLLAAGLMVSVVGSGPSGPSARADNASFPFTKLQQKLLSGFASFELGISGDNENDPKPSNYFPRSNDECPVNLSSNIKVNQSCENVSDPDLQGRAQAQNETSVAINPMDTNELIASSNDYRRGDGNCYAYYSTDNGRTWNDSTVPMGFVRGTAFGAARQYFQAGGDTSVAWDTKGNAYIDCQMFQRGGGVTPNPDLSSAFYVFRSTGNNGASWNFPGRPVTESSDVTGTGIPPFEDKPYMTVDNHVGSPFQDRIYVAWTEFSSDGTAYIWESYSSDYGEHFSPRHLVSADSDFCFNTFGVPTPHGRCNENQFANPFTGPDGNLYIAYQNFNNQPPTGADNRYQVLIAKSTDGGNTFSAPVKVSDYYDLPDCFTYQGKDAGRSCVPEKGASTNSYFRGVNYPSGAVNPTNPQQVVVTFGSYINRNSNEANGCVPAGFSAFGNPDYTGVKTPGTCNNKILISVSTDGGATFTGTAADPRTEPTVNTASGQATTDQFWQWEAFTKNGKLAVSYYDRQYGSDETTGFTDVSLSGSGDLANYVVNRVTSDSMPPETQFSGTFFGDYNALAAYTDAHPVWMDTRDPELFICPNVSPPALCTGSASNASIANDQDIFTASLPVPSK